MKVQMPNPHRKTSTAVKQVGLHFFACLILSAFALNACTSKKRDDQIQQGQGENLLFMQDYHNKIYEIQTLGIAKTDLPLDVQIEKPQRKFSLKSKNAQEFPLVNYTKTAKLLQEVPLRGRPNFKYEALYRVTDNYLKIYQVGAKMDIDVRQHTYAEVLEDGRLAVPLMGYPIKGFVKLENLKNADHEKTHVLGEFSEERDQAQAFRIDANAAQIFETIEKEDEIYAEYFKGDWYFAATVVGASQEQQGALGFELAYDEKENPSNRIKFVLSETQLQVQNINIDDRVDDKDNLNLGTALTLPIQWKEYELAPKGRDKELRERLNTTKAWNQRRFIQLSLADTKSYIAERGGRLTGLELNDNYFSYTLELEQQKLRVRYSFLRAPKTNTYVSKIHFSDDAKKFGFFTSQKAFADNFEVQRKEDLEKHVLISRFNPKTSKIVFHFTKSSPTWARPAARKSIAAWDQAFAAAGTNIRIVLDEDKEVDLGDLRYNAINLVESITPSDYLGFGPSVADPISGEIISATTNVHLTPIEEGLAREILNFVRSELGLLTAGYSQGVSGMLQQLNNMVVATSETNNQILVSGNFLTAPFQIKGFKKTPDAPAKTIEFRRNSKSRGHDQDLSISSSNIHQEIRNECPEVLSYIADLKSQNQSHSEQEKSVVKQCARKMIGQKLQGTLIHELGHNFGLRHNFMGSVDANNFWPKAVTETKELVRSSSVMEYTSFNEDRLTVAGAYDIAAIRYGYADAVLESDNKSILKLDIKKSIQENLAGKTARTYMFCTDEDVMRSTSPFCNRWDAGTSAKEIVSNYIQSYHTSTALLNYRYDGIATNPDFAITMHRVQNYFVPMRRFYEEWRLHLSQFLGGQFRYLENLDEPAYKEILLRMQKDAKYGPIYQAYRPAAELIYEFFKAVAHQPNRYCVVQASDGEQKLMELQPILKQVYASNSNLRPKSCTDSQNYLSSLGLELLGQSGDFLNNIRFDLNPEQAKESWDIVGNYLDRWVASIFLTAHLPQSLNAGQQNFMPSLLDEPQFRTDWASTLESRVLQGVDTDFVREKIENATTLRPRMPLFKSESNLLVSQFEDFYRLGLIVPDDIIETNRRRHNYQANLMSIPSATGASTELISGYYFNSASGVDGFAARLVAKHDELALALDPNEGELNVLQSALAFVEENVPTKAKADELTIKDFIEIVSKAVMFKTDFGPAMIFWQELTKEELRARTLINLKRSEMEMRTPLSFQNLHGLSVEEWREQEVNEFLSQKASVFYSKKDKPYNFNMENYKARILLRIEEVSKQSQAAQLQLDLNRVETSAQLDLLKKIMVQLAN